MIKGTVFLHAALLVKRVCMVIHISTFLISINPCRQGWEQPCAKALQMCWTYGRTATERAGRQSCCWIPPACCVPNVMSMPHVPVGFPETSGPAPQGSTPWQKLIQIALLGVCSQGEVVPSWVVLTASHCLTDGSKWKDLVAQWWWVSKGLAHRPSQAWWGAQEGCREASLSLPVFP